MYGGGNYYADEVSGIVLDIGCHLTRAGYAGEDTPKVVIPSYIGMIENPDPNQMDVEGIAPFAGEKIMKYRDFMKLEQVFAEGGDKSEKLEEICREAIENELKLNPREHPFLLSEPSIHDRESRVALTEMMFEKFQIPAFYIVKSAVLSSFASGRSTSLVLDSGAYTTWAVPVHDGYVLQKSIVKFNIGGETITDVLLNHLVSLGVNIRPHYTFNKTVKCFVEGGEVQGNPEFTLEDIPRPNVDPSYQDFSIREIVRDIKETTFKVSDNTFSETSFANVPSSSYELPDGTQVQLGNERYRIPELLFSSGIEGVIGFSGVHQMVYDSITRCDMDIRRELYGNVVVTGGNSLFGGFTDRLHKKLTELTTQNMKVKLIAPQSTIERRFSSWIGGSILASLGSFQQMWMSKQEYDEHGAILIERKCP
ncbi:ARP4_1 [Blepharisma stoltei]|uniref:Actin n=1 Tax=Blepharisma stoltei TaxID=1481888 RepID=A0AAU9IQH1_9CILI|nr:unnamed protein product [Blepharisma stoltei]